jgi:hypothetical protein
MALATGVWPKWKQRFLAFRPGRVASTTPHDDLDMVKPLRAHAAGVGALFTTDLTQGRVVVRRLVERESAHGGGQSLRPLLSLVYLSQPGQAEDRWAHGHVEEAIDGRQQLRRVHLTLRATAAMEAGLPDHVWTIEETVGLLG